MQEIVTANEAVTAAAGFQIEFFLKPILPLIVLCAAALFILLLDAFVERARKAKNSDFKGPFDMRVVIETPLHP